MIWRYILVLFIIFGISSAPYHSPFDMYNISRTNNNYFLLDQNLFSSANAQNSSINISFGRISRIMNVSLSFDFAGSSVMYQNSIYPLDNSYLFFAKGTRFSSLIALPSSGYPDFSCNSSVLSSDYAWRCDFDFDDCAEYQNNTYSTNHLTATLSFKNDSVSIPLSSSFLAIPESLLIDMKNSSGTDPLNVQVFGTVDLGYNIDDRAMGLECYDVFKNYSHSFPINVNYSIPVLGSNSFVFLASPVLGEQWFRNNRFDIVLLSQYPISESGYLFDGNMTSNTTLRDFTLNVTNYGLEFIQPVYQNHSDLNYSEFVNYTTPIPLSKSNLSYSYIYRFNYSYVGLGNHSLYFYWADPFLGQVYSFNQSLLSRTLSYGGKYSEVSQITDPALLRPSSNSSNLITQNVSLVVGGIFLLLLFIGIKFFKN